MASPLIAAALLAACALGSSSPGPLSFVLAQSSTPAQGASAAEDPLAQEFAALDKEFQAARDAFMESYKSAPSAEDRQELYLENYPPIHFWPRFEALAKRAGTSDVAIEAWFKVIELYSGIPEPDSTSDQTPADRALTQLLGAHLESTKLARLPSLLAYADQATREWKLETVFDTLLEKNPHAAVQGPAAYQLAGRLARRSKAADQDARRARAIALYERVANDYGELPLHANKTLGAAANGALFELRHLQIGMAAPDFEATDQDGVKFKISDYRGKVVVLDFWGFW